MTNQKLHELIADGKFDLAQEYLKYRLDYNPETGVFKWKNNSHKSIKNGSVAGSYDSYGYIIIVIDYILYKAHRIAWLYTNGFLPEETIDHINRDRSDNRIENLRVASLCDNARNRSMISSNTSGYKGVSYSEATGKFRAAYKFEGKLFYIGMFETAKEAACHYDLEAIKNYGEFCVTNESLGLLDKEDFKNLSIPYFSKGKSKYKGVSKAKGKEKFTARIYHGGKRYFLGYFDTEEDAAREYDKKVTELKGPRARTNESVGLIGPA